MKIILNQACREREGWTLTASGTFNEGVHIVTGAVGSGKSTLLLMIAGLIPLTRGSIDRPAGIPCMVSLQFPELQVTGRTLTEECVSWGSSAESILSAAGLSGCGERAPLSLSRGELKRLSLACVLAGDHPLLLLDEPFSSLDCRQKADLCRILELKRGGITIIFTHEHSILPRVDRIWEIIGGELIDRGLPPAAFDHWVHAPPMVKELVSQGRRPDNISVQDIREAACRTRG